MDSILNSVKKKLGISADYEQFDNGDIIDHIILVFMILNQLGVGPSVPFRIADNSTGEETWSDFTNDISTLELVRPYVALRVRKAFDPPQSSAHMEALNSLISEYEWRLNVAVDPKEDN